MTLKVIDAETGKEISDAGVRALFPHDLQPAMLQVTNSTGTNGLARLLIPSIAFDAMKLTVRVTAVGYSPREVMWFAVQTNVRSAFTESRTVQLTPGITIGGIVLDERGAPLPGASVEIDGNDSAGFELLLPATGVDEYPAFSTVVGAAPTTDAQGRWTVSDVPANLKHLRLSVVRPDGARQTFSTCLPPPPFTLNDDEEVSLAELRQTNAVTRLRAGITVRGHVVGPNGMPVTNATVLESLGLESTPCTGRTTTDIDGWFMFPHRLPREIGLTVVAAGYATTGILIQVASNAPSLTIAVTNSTPLWIAVVDTNHGPIAGAQVDPAPYGNEGMVLEWFANTDNYGNALWRDPPKPPFTLQITYRGTTCIRKIDEFGPAGRQQFVRIRPGMNDTVQVSGLLWEDDTLRRVPNALVSVSTGWIRSFQPSERDGTFLALISRKSFPRGRPRYSVQVQAPGYAPWQVDNLDFETGDEWLEIKPQKLVEVKGKVVTAVGVPATNVSVAVHQEPNTVDFSRLGNQYAIAKNAFTTNSDARGEFRLTGISSNRWISLKSPLGFGTVRAAELATGAIRLKPWGGITGTLLVRGAPLTNVTVHLHSFSLKTNPFVSFEADAITDALGRFRFTEVPEGEFQLTHIRQGRLGGFEFPVSVRAGEVARVPYSFAGRTVRGRVVATSARSTLRTHSESQYLVTCPQGHAEPRREHFVSDETYQHALGAWYNDETVRRNYRHHPFIVAADGTFEVPDVPPGEYDLMWAVHTPRAHCRNQDEFSFATSDWDYLRLRVVVPSMTSGKPDDPVDIGPHTIDLDNLP